MKIVDINQNLKSPDGTLESVNAEGAYLRLTYVWLHPYAPVYTRTNVFLNDMGREVARTFEEVCLPKELKPPAPPAPAPVAPWFRFKNGFLIALLGIQEMVTCLSK